MASFDALAALPRDAIYRLLVESIHDFAIYMLDPDGIVTSWNAGAQRFKGYTAEEIVGRHFECFYTAEDRAAGAPAATLASARSAGQFEGEGWRVRRDGRRFWAHVVIDAVHDADGALIGFAKITRDLTERREAEALAQANLELQKRHLAAIETEKLFRQMFEAGPNAVIMTDAAGRIAMANPRAERMFGYAQSELIGQPLQMLLPGLHPGQLAQLADDAAPLPATRIGSAGSLFSVTQDGSRLQVEIGLSPLHTEQGTMVLLAIADISQRIRLEEQVRHSQKVDAIGRVAAGVAHDFNNLLMALGGSLELLLDEVAGRPQALELGRIALNAAERGKGITSRMLALVHKQPLDAGVVAIDALFAELQQMVRTQFQSSAGARTTVVVTPSAPGLAALADRGQLLAALINLAINARDAMGVSGGCLRLSAGQSDADPTLVSPGRYTVISIADTGAGMDAVTLANACDPFFTTKGARGTGLGLAIAQAFARQSGGELHIVSTVGEGTTVNLWLPAADLAEPPDQIAKTVCDKAQRILLVDDSEDSLLVVAAFLRSSGFTVVTQPSADLALATLSRSEPFDAIISDLAMPDLNGVEFLKLAAQVAPNTPALIITGFSEPTVLAALHGFTVLHKPFNRAGLCEAVHALIGATAIDRAPARQSMR